MSKNTGIHGVIIKTSEALPRASRNTIREIFFVRGLSASHTIDGSRFAQFSHKNHAAAVVQPLRSIASYNPPARGV